MKILQSEPIVNSLFLSPNSSLVLLFNFFERTICLNIFRKMSTTAATLKLVQYVVVRKDLLDVMKWPVGAVIAQACHACAAVIHLNYSDGHTQEYLKDLDNMHKVVLEVSVFISI